MNRVAVLNVVALSPNLIGEHTPAIAALAERSGGVRTMTTTTPAVTTTVQTSMLTGATVSEHGIVANGWYDRTEGQVKFWKQSNRLVEAEPVWKTARQRDPGFTCANICWWYAMNSDVDVYVTPRPIYRANGRKVPDCLTRPGELRDQLQAKHGTFPLFKFWGPGASIESTRWIVDAALDVEQASRPWNWSTFPTSTTDCRNSVRIIPRSPGIFAKSMPKSHDCWSDSIGRASR
jgi:predicted AlkP superfamily pyrophosphatase or phosphodiesterase